MSDILSNPQYTLQQVAMVHSLGLRCRELEDERAKLVLELEVHRRRNEAGEPLAYPSPSPSSDASVSGSSTEADTVRKLEAQLEEISTQLTLREAKLATLAKERDEHALELHNEMQRLRKQLQPQLGSDPDALEYEWDARRLQEDIRHLRMQLERKRVLEGNAGEYESNNTQELEDRANALRSKLEAQAEDIKRYKLMAEQIHARHVQTEKALEAEKQQRAQLELQSDTQLHAATQKIIHLEQQLSRSKAAAARQFRERVIQTEAVLQPRGQPTTGATNGVRIRLPPRPHIAASAKSSTTQTSRTPARPASSSKASKSRTVDLPAHASPIPPKRSQVLDTFPVINPDIPEALRTVCFTRKDLAKLVGGNMQSLIVPVTDSATAFAKKWGITEYLCPNMEHNPWAPKRPGDHGYMMVGLGRERDTFNEAVIRHIFVGAESTYQYCGKYEVKRVERLTLAEWMTLPEKVRTQYSETTGNKEKHKKHGNTQHILAQYNAGELRAPCVLLRCLEFDTKFCEDLTSCRRVEAIAGMKRTRLEEESSAESDVSPKRARGPSLQDTPSRRQSDRIGAKLVRIQIPEVPPSHQ